MVALVRSPLTLGSVSLHHLCCTEKIEGPKRELFTLDMDRPLMGGPKRLFPSGRTTPNLELAASGRSEAVLQSAPVEDGLL